MQTKIWLLRLQRKKEKDTGGKVKLQETTKVTVESLVVVEREMAITKSLELRLRFWISVPDLHNALNKAFISILAALLCNERMRPSKFQIFFLFELGTLTVKPSKKCLIKDAQW